MNVDQLLIIAVLGATMALFIWGRWRYDVVALVALLSTVLLGIVPSDHAFTGFSHPAVITVAAVLIMSRALQASGVVDWLASWLAHTRHTVILQIGATSGLTALLSAFMNNIGALALMLPVALRNVRKSYCRPSMILMPISFASLLGGLVTLIGTPPNIIIATFRADTGGEPFGMFDFTPVGLPVAVAGLGFLAFFGWRLIPHHAAQDESPEERFHIANYIFQATVPASSALIDMQVCEVERACGNEATVMAIIRGRRRILAPVGVETLDEDDIVIFEGDPAALQPLFDNAGLVRVGAENLDPELLHSSEVQVIEAVVMPGSSLEGWSMRGLRMHENYGINLLAMSRQANPPVTRLGSIRFKVGDVLLLQGERASLRETLNILGCLPLAGRGLTLRLRRRALLPFAIFAAAVTVVGLRAVPIQIAFVAGAVGVILSGAVSLREAYRSIEWPIIILLGALIPVGEALQTTGVTGVIAQTIVESGDELPVAALLALIIVASMWLSDLVHNSPTAILMAPIAVAISVELALPADAFLMAVAIGAASPYLTPVGHQSNMLVMAPGGYRFGDYWRIGLPLQVVILVVSVPMILWVWMP